MISELEWQRKLVQLEAGLRLVLVGGLLAVSAGCASGEVVAYESGQTKIVPTATLPRPTKTPEFVTAQAMPTVVVTDLPEVTETQVWTPTPEILVDRPYLASGESYGDIFHGGDKRYVGVEINPVWTGNWGIENVGGVNHVYLETKLVDGVGDLEVLRIRLASPDDPGKFPLYTTTDGHGFSFVTGSVEELVAQLRVGEQLQVRLLVDRPRGGLPGKQCFPNTGVCTDGYISNYELWWQNEQTMHNLGDQLRVNGDIDVPSGTILPADKVAVWRP